MMAQTESNLNRKRRWMIAYDISDDKQRRVVHELLKDHGQRVQYSVFECELSKQQLMALRTQLSAALDAEDSIRWYPLCRWCEANVDWVGQGQAPQFDDYHLL